MKEQYFQLTTNEKEGNEEQNILVNEINTYNER